MTLVLDVTTWFDRGRLVVELAGEVDAYSVPRLREALASADGVAPLRIAVVCERLAFIDSSGVGVLIGAVKRAQITGGRVALVGCRGPVERMVRLLGLHQVMGLCGSLEDAFTWLDLAVR